MIHLDQDGDVWTITLDRPDKANALTPGMLAELANVAERAQTAKLFILTGTGRVFSAGADLDAAKAGLATSPDWERLSNAIAALPGLTVAALNGTVAGGACGMALACDLRIATEGSKLFYPVMRLGFLPQPSDVVRMSRLIGPAQTKRILMVGQKITASDALDMGLFQQIVSEGSLLATARDLGSDTMGADLRHVSAIKSMIDAAAPCPATSTTA